MILLIYGMAWADEPDETPNYCYSESVLATKGTSFPVKIMLHNIDTLIAVQVPFYYRSENVDLTCDSISFYNTRLKDQSLSFHLIEPKTKVALFAFISMVSLDPSKPTLLPGDGPIAVIWFTAGKDINSGTVKIESGPHAFYPHEWIDYSYHFWQSTENDLTRDVDVDFRPGTITIK